MKPLEMIDIDPSELLQRVQGCVRDVITPTWVVRPPADVGTARAGTIKAYESKTLFDIHVPFAALSLWKEESPLAGNEAGRMGPALETSMHLTCAALWMTKKTLTPDRRDRFRHHLIQHLEGLKQHFRGYIVPNHHMMLHIFDFMEEFSGVRHWWAFPFERMIGMLERTPTNHKTGMIHSIIHTVDI